ncbi:MAG: hypothetical protein ACFB6S_14680 [Geminicoccaceae bacterium]
MDRIGRLIVALRTLVLASLATGAGGAAAQTPTDADDADWVNAQEIGTLEAFERYLERNPTGKYAAQAFYRVTVMSIDASRSFQNIEPGAGPTNSGSRNVASDAIDVY